MKIGQLILICLALVYSLAFGDQIINQQSQVSGIEFSVVQTDRNLTVVDIRFPEAMVSDTLIDGKSFDLLWMKGMGQMSRVGYPQLPQTTRLLAIDATGEFQVNVSDVQYLEYDGLNVLPAQPPVSLDWLVACTDAEVAEFTQHLDYVRLVLEAGEVPTDEVLAASVRIAASARSEAEREVFLIEAGREIARLLAGDPVRLEGLVRRLCP